MFDWIGNELLDGLIGVGIVSRRRKNNRYNRICIAGKWSTDWIQIHSSNSVHYYYYYSEYGWETAKEGKTDKNKKK